MEGTPTQPGHEHDYYRHTKQRTFQRYDTAKRPHLNKVMTI